MSGSVSKNIRSRLAPAVRGEYLPYESSGTRVLWSLPAPKKCELIGGGSREPDLFASVMKVRTETDVRWPDQRTPADAYSDHYCLSIEGKPVGCLSMTRGLHGEIFLQEYFPPAFFDIFPDRLMSAYRFRLMPAYRRTSASIRRH